MLDRTHTTAASPETMEEVDEPVGKRWRRRSAVLGDDWRPTATEKEEDQTWSEAYWSTVVVQTRSGLLPPGLD